MAKDDITPRILYKKDKLNYLLKIDIKNRRNYMIWRVFSGQNIHFEYIKLINNLNKLVD